MLYKRWQNKFEERVKVEKKRIERSLKMKNYVCMCHVERQKEVVGSIVYVDSNLYNIKYFTSRQLI